jgi:mRNA interferase RelE/StbE
MTYKLEFLPSARKEWDKLGHTLREQFKKNLESLPTPCMGCLIATKSN